MTTLAPLAIAALAACAAGCQTLEQRATAQGIGARTDVARACEPAKAAGAIADGGAEGEAACRARACAVACADAGTSPLQQTCAAACDGTGRCTRDDDCAAGLRCVAIAPVVRRCAPAPAASP